MTFNARIPDTIFSFKGDRQVIFVNTHFFFLLQTACFLMIVITRELKPMMRYCEMLQSFGEFKPYFYVCKSHKPTLHEASRACDLL